MTAIRLPRDVQPTVVHANLLVVSGVRSRPQLAETLSQSARGLAPFIASSRPGPMGVGGQRSPWGRPDPTPILRRRRGECQGRGDGWCGTGTFSKGGIVSPQNRRPVAAKDGVLRSSLPIPVDQPQPVRGVPRAFLGTSVHAKVAGCCRYWSRRARSRASVRSRLARPIP